MAIILQGNAGINADVEATTRALRSVQYPPNVGSNGAFRVCATSGLITTVAAATATAGHIFAARWTHASKLAIITRFKARWITVTAFTSAQEVGLDLIAARSFSASYTGGTGLTLSGNTQKKRTSYASTNFGDIRVATTGALTAGTQTLDSQPLAQSGTFELATGATVQHNSFELLFASDEMQSHPIILATNEGLVLRNIILMGAAGTARVFIEMDWLEVDAYPAA